MEGKRPHCIADGRGKGHLRTPFRDYSLFSATIRAEAFLPEFPENLKKAARDSRRGLPWSTGSNVTACSTA